MRLCCVHGQPDQPVLMQRTVGSRARTEAFAIAMFSVF